MGKIENKISEYSQFPLEVISNTPKFEITGRNKILIENHKGIKSLSNEMIEIKLSIGIFVVEGESILINEINKDHILISGNFSFFKFE